jgi:hypothetical protein
MNTTGADLKKNRNFYFISGWEKKFVSLASQGLW